MTMITRNLPSLLVAGFLALALPATAFAAGSSSSTTTGDSGADKISTWPRRPSPNSNMTRPRAIWRRCWRRRPDNADALNLMGFTERKLGDPTDSLTYYNKALAQNPNHLGANEYLGELYLEMKDVKKAEERLAVLQQACGGTCEEYQELKEKIDQFKATNS